MKDVQDRIVQFSNRYKLTNAETGEVLGTFDFDEVTGTVQQVGTEIDKELFDSIAADLAARVKLSGGELAGTIVTFSDISGTAANVASGDKTSTLWSKVKNWFSRLKALAFKNKVAAGDFEAGAIKNADVSADAAIAQSKVSGLMTDYVASISVSGRTVTYKNKNGVNMGSITTQDTTYGLASQSGNGLMSSTDKTKLDGIESGAQKNTVLGVKGSSESAYRTGNVNITKENIGLGNVDNTSDSDKPVSTATQMAIDLEISERKAADQDLQIQINELDEATQAVNAVKYVEQSLTSEQKSQARTNISAASVDDVEEIESNLNNSFSEILQENIGKYSIRQTANGSDIFDGALTQVESIQGDTVATSEGLKNAFFSSITSTPPAGNSSATDTLSVSTPIELTKYDTAYPAENKVVRGGQTVVFDGSDDEGWSYNSTYKIYFSTQYGRLVAEGTTQSTPVYSNPDISWNGNANFVSNIGDVTQSDYPTVQEWKAHLAANPVTVCFPVKEPIEETVVFNKFFYRACSGGMEKIESQSFNTARIILTGEETFEDSGEENIFMIPFVENPPVGVSDFSNPDSDLTIKPTATASHYNVLTLSEILSKERGLSVGIYEEFNIGVIFICDNSYKTKEEFKAHLSELYNAGNPVSITYRTSEFSDNLNPIVKCTVSQYYVNKDSYFVQAEAFDQKLELQWLEKNVAHINGTYENMTVGKANYANTAGLATTSKKANTADVATNSNALEGHNSNYFTDYTDTSVSNLEDKIFNQLSDYKIIYRHVVQYDIKVNSNSDFIVIFSEISDGTIDFGSYAGLLNALKNMNNGIPVNGYAIYNNEPCVPVFLYKSGESTYIILNMLKPGSSIVQMVSFSEGMLEVVSNYKKNV